MVTSDKDHKIMNALSGKVLDVAHDVQVIQYPYQRSNNQLWKFIPLSKDQGYFKISPLSDLNMCLECKTTHVEVSKWNPDGLDSQKWTLIQIQVEDCSGYRIENKSNSNFISVTDLQSQAVILSKEHSDETDKWFIVPNA